MPRHKAEQKVYDEKEKLEDWWNIPRRKERWGQYLRVWVEQRGIGNSKNWIVRSNMINGLPPSPGMVKGLEHFKRMYPKKGAANG